jgi:hypothetical protein
MRKFILLLSLSFLISGCTLVPKPTIQQNDDKNTNIVKGCQFSVVTDAVNDFDPGFAVVHNIKVGELVGGTQFICPSKASECIEFCNNIQKCPHQNQIPKGEILRVLNNEECHCSCTQENTLTDGNKTNENKDGRTYTNTHFNFSFKYPANWKVTEYKYQSDEPLSANSIKVFDQNGIDGSFSICPENRGTDCIPFQDAQWDSTISNVVVDGYSGTKTLYTVKSADCKSCTPRSTVTLSTKPAGWADGRDFLLTSGSNKSLSIPEKILSTIIFTDQATSSQDAYY